MYSIKYAARTSLVLGLTLLMVAGCKKSEQPDNSVKNDEVEKLSETMGFFVIENLKTQNVVINVDSFIKGIENAQAGKQPPLSKEEFAQLFMNYRKQAFEVKGSENLKIAEDYLAKNKEGKGIVALEDGKLQYQILQEGSGETVEEDGTPLINYEGKFADGTVFDSTQAKGAPVPISLETTIPGFKAGLNGMKKGEKRRLFIHPDLGYGTKGRLPPNSLLIFDVEVVEADTKKPEEKPEEKETKESGLNWLRKWTGI